MPQSKYGGIPVEEAPKSKYGGVAVEDAPASSPATPAPGANPARNIRQRNLNRSLTPVQAQARREAVSSVVSNYPGMQDLTRGVQEIQTPGQRKAGAHHLITGAGKAASPALLPYGLVAAPAATLYGVGTGMAASMAGEGVSRLAGADPDTSALVGDASGIVAGGMAGAPGPVGAATRGAVRGGLGKVPIISSLLKGAWEGAQSGLEKEGFAAPKSPPAGTPKSAPSAPSAPVENTAELDTIARSLGGKDFASIPGPQQAAVRRIAAGGAAPNPAPSPAPKPAPSNGQVTPASNVVEKAEPVASKPRTINEMLDRELADRRAAATPPAAPAGEAARSDSDIARAAAQNLVKQGVTVDQLLAMSEGDRAAALGNDAHRFPDIIREMRSHISGGKMDVARGNKDEGLVKFFKAKGITPEQVEAMDDGTLATHIKSAGYRIPGKSGALGRSSAQIRHDVGKLMREGGDTSPSQAPTPTPTPTAPANPPAAAAPPATGGGVQAIVRTPSGTKAKVQYKISEADDLKTSFDPDYNTEIGHQPRDTSRIGSRQRVEQRKADMDPEAMGGSRMAGDGAPITKEGNAVTRNHGTQALKENYQANNAKAQEYREWVQEQSGLAGMDPGEVAKMKNPILHRELLEDWDHPTTKNFANEANEPSVAQMSDSEMARQMSERMTGSIMNRFDPTDEGIPNSDFVREITNGLPVEAQAKFQTKDGKISQTGIRLIRNAIFDKAYQSTEALEAMAEDPEPQVRNITTGMLKAAARNAQLQEAVAQGKAYPLGIGKEAGRAVEIINNLREKKLSVSDWLKQADLLGRDPVIHSLVDILAGESRRPNLIRDTLNGYADLVRQLGTPEQEGFFGAPELPSKLELLEKAYEQSKSAAAEAAARRKGKSEAEDLLGPDPGGSPAGAGPIPASH